MVKGMICLGVTGNYSVLMNEFQQNYIGWAIAVDYTKHIHGPSLFNLLQIHYLNIDFCVTYLDKKCMADWLRQTQWKPSQVAALCNAAQCASLNTDPIQLFNVQTRPLKAVTGVLLCAEEHTSATTDFTGIKCDPSSIPNITTMGAETWIGEITLQAFPRQETSRISIGSGASSRLKTRWYRRGHINFSYGMLCRRGATELTNPRTFRNVSPDKLQTLGNDMHEQLASKIFYALTYLLYIMIYIIYFLKWY